MNHSVLLTDLYQLTMADAYYQSGKAEDEAVFHLYFRKPPFKGGYALACGLERAAEFLENFRFSSEEISYLSGLTGADGKRLFSEDFLDAMAELKFTCDVDAVEEGTPVFANEPLIRVRGPISQCQLIETPLLNFVNFETLIATKASRLREAVKDDQLLEFGMRRAQGPDGAMAASRAAYVGGADATSNVLAGMKFGIPVKGTHAHSWVMSFDTEREAFEAYARAMPHNSVFLVDTYDTLDGVQRATEMAKIIEEKGHRLGGIRLDSGDLAYLSIEARKILDQAGLNDAKIVASNDLNENIIESLKAQGAKIDVWGVGTQLATAYDQPALGGVYKLAAIREKGAEWEHRLKLSEQAVKVSTPGILGVRRYFDGETYAGDLIYDELSGIEEPATLVDPADFTRRKPVSDFEFEELLVPIFKGGSRVYQSPGAKEARQRARTELGKFHASIRRFMNPHEYPVGFDARLHKLKTELILKARGLAQP